ncbi:MAG: cytochrome c family protein [Candidatus Moduliflexus flocculans]|nr:cytochrome c family protein [Candidatus Moduliflexus flocculans]
MRPITPPTPALRAAGSAMRSSISSGPRPGTGLPCSRIRRDFALRQLTPQQNEIVIKKHKYRADLNDGVVDGDRAERHEELQDRTRARRKERLLFPDASRQRQAPDPAASPMMSTRRNGSIRRPAACATSREESRGEAVDWKDSPYTFNTACYSCHVSQLSTNYDPKTDTYHTTWTEPGINCETCHGSSVEHNRIAKATPKGEPLPELRIISTKTMTKAAAQRSLFELPCEGEPADPRVQTRGTVL